MRIFLNITSVVVALAAIAGILFLVSAPLEQNPEKARPHLKQPTKSAI